MSRLETSGKSVRRTQLAPRVHLVSLLRPLLNRKSLLALLIVILAASFITVRRIRDRAQHQLDQERARLEKQNLIPFETKAHSPLVSKEIQLWQSYRNSRAIARFRDSYFVATDGGLLELDASGSFRRHYSILDGLPESDLVSIASFNGELFIGTRSQGLVSFDGETFTSYRWLDRSPQSVNVLFADGGRLLIGTMAGGLIEYDSRQFKEIKVGSEQRRVPGIIHLSKNGGTLFVGTFANGLWIAAGARWSQFTVADGLPSNRIVGVVAGDRQLLVAADYGLATAAIASLSVELTQRSTKVFSAGAVLPSLTGIVQFGPHILACKDGGECFAVEIGGDVKRMVPLNLFEWKTSEPLVGCRLTVLERQLWLLSNDGIRQAEARDDDNTSLSSPARVGSVVNGSSRHSLEPNAGRAFLTSNLISALTLDSQGRLWAGGFRNGIDVLTADGRQLAHLESETNRELNSLVEDQRTRTMLAATSRGLLRFDANFRETGRWSTSDGLLSNSVMQVAQSQAKTDLQDSYVACATGKGLTFGVQGRLRSLTSMQGLPSNSLYAVLAQGHNLYVGTLNGLVLIQDGRVTRVFKDTNSNLKPNWVTALCQVGGRLFVGTYGGGIFELTGSGELNHLASGTARTFVNANAMWGDGRRLYIGTLDGALMFDLGSQKWVHITAELPSRTVLSVAGDERYVYFGTTSGIARVAQAYWNQEL